MPRFTDLGTLKTGYLDWRKDDDDDFLTMLLESSETFFEQTTGRRFSPDPELDDEGADSAEPVTKFFPSFGIRMLALPDLREVESVVLGSSELAPASATTGDGYELVGSNGVAPATAIRIPWTTRRSFLYNDVAITGRWGWVVAPADVQDAVYVMAARAFKERAATYSDSVETAAGTITYFRAMPPRVASVADLYRRVAV